MLQSKKLGRRDLLRTGGAAIGAVALAGIAIPAVGLARAVTHHSWDASAGPGLPPVADRQSSSSRSSFRSRRSRSRRALRSIRPGLTPAP